MTWASGTITGYRKFGLESVAKELKKNDLAT
jgi:hypothetical protein